MPATNIASAFESMVIQVSVDDGVALELGIDFLSHQGAVVNITAPPEFAGNTIHFPHVPYFAMPGIFGYHYGGRLTPKFTDRLVQRTREWYSQRRAVEHRIEEIYRFQAVGLSDREITEWIKAETGVRFQYGMLGEILHGLAAPDTPRSDHCGLTR
jgi:hypothetical protein